MLLEGEQHLLTAARAKIPIVGDWPVATKKG
jgi:hypothetical protein